MIQQQQTTSTTNQATQKQTVAMTSQTVDQNKYADPYNAQYQQAKETYQKDNANISSTANSSSNTSNVSSSNANRNVNNNVNNNTSSNTSSANNHVNNATSQATVVPRTTTKNAVATSRTNVSSNVPVNYQTNNYALNLAAQPDQQIANVNPPTTNDNSQITQYQGLQESSFDTDKAVYNPGDMVHMSLGLKNPESFDQFGTYKLNVFNPLTSEQTVASGSWKTSKNGGLDTIKIDWQTPKTDNQGYVLNLQLFTSTGKLLDEFDNAVDVDTDIYRHPRYGALTDYSANTIDQQKAAIDSFAKKYHMNMQMLYDCYFRPQNPCPDQDSWVDWHGDTISKAAIEADINQIHADGSKAFLYDMINAYTGEEGDKDADLGPIDVKTVKDGNNIYNSGPTGMFYPSNSNQKGQQFHCVIGNNLDTADQWYNDPANSQWQNYIIPKIMDAMQRMGFDGWQGDTNGQMIGNTYANRGTDKTINDADFYYYFVQAVQKAFNGKYTFGLNAVNNVGQDAIATKSDPTFDYTELWPSSFKTYNDIGNVIEQNWKNDGKPLIVPAYLYDQWRNNAAGGKGDALPKTYNDNVVRQLAATIMAHGGSPMILSDGGYLLDDEYYPWPRFQNGKSINMDNNLGNPNTGYMRHYFDFDTAYENILQDPALKANNNYIQVWTGNGVGQGNWVNRSDGEANTVYAFSKNKNGLDTLNLVNLMGSTNQWQVYNSSDNNQHNVQPQKNLWVKFYPSEQTQNIKHIYMSSPDSAYQGKRVELPFKEYTDPSGHKYVEFEVPSLEIWDLIYMTPDDPVNLAVNQPTATNKPSNGSSTTGKPSSGSQPASGSTTTDKPANGSSNSQPASGSTTTDKPSNGSSMTDKPSSGSQPVSGSTVVNKPANGSATIDKPSLGSQPVSGSTVVNKPSNGSSTTGKPSSGSQPVSGSTVVNKPSNGSSTTGKPSSSSQPVSGSTVVNKPSNGSLMTDKPSSGSQPVSGSTVVNKPSNGSSTIGKPSSSSQPVSGSTVVNKPSNGSATTDKPSSGSQPVSGSTVVNKPANGSATTDKPASGSQPVSGSTTVNKPSTGSTTTNKPASGSQPVSGSTTVNKPSTGSTTTNKPASGSQPVSGSTTVNKPSTGSTTTNKPSTGSSTNESGSQSTSDSTTTDKPSSGNQIASRLAPITNASQSNRSSAEADTCDADDVDRPLINANCAGTKVVHHVDNPSTTDNAVKPLTLSQTGEGSNEALLVGALAMFGAVSALTINKKK